MEHPFADRPEPLASLSWDDLRVFLKCVETKSFRQAASRLCTSASTITRSIEALEDQLDAALFNRMPEGLSLTVAGQAILTSVRAMEQASFEVARARSLLSAERSAVVVSITEGLGSYWIMPQLVQFERQNPQIIARLLCGMHSADVLRMEADMSVQLQQPKNPDLKVVRLGRLHVFPYASPGYLRRYGTPKPDNSDMIHHKLVQQIAPQLDQNAWGRALGIEPIDQIVSISADASTAILYAIENGAGIGALPTYTGVINSRIVPVDLNGRYSMDIWLAYHPTARQDLRKAYMIDWIRRAFDNKRYPWFGDEFIHPRELGHQDLFGDV